MTDAHFERVAAVRAAREQDAAGGLPTMHIPVSSFGDLAGELRITALANEPIVQVARTAQGKFGWSEADALLFIAVFALRELRKARMAQSVNKAQAKTTNQIIDRNVIKEMEELTREKQRQDEEKRHFQPAILPGVNRDRWICAEKAKNEVLGPAGAGQWVSHLVVMGPGETLL